MDTYIIRFEERCWIKIEKRIYKKRYLERYKKKMIRKYKKRKEDPKTWIKYNRITIIAYQNYIIK
jgi:hypothetical protein